MVDLLLKYKADFNAKNNTLGRTPLHLAYDGGHQTIIDLLEASGASKNIKDNVGKIPEDYLISKCCPDAHNESMQSISSSSNFTHLEFCERYLGGTMERSFQKTETFDEFLKRTMGKKYDSEKENSNIDNEDTKEETKELAEECDLPKQILALHENEKCTESAINPLSTEESQNNGTNLKKDLDTLVEEDSRLECSTERKHYRSIISVNKESIAHKTDYNSRSVIDFRASKLEENIIPNAENYCSDIKAANHHKNDSISSLQALRTISLNTLHKHKIIPSILEQSSIVITGDPTQDDTDVTIPLNYSKLSEITIQFILSTVSHSPDKTIAATIKSQQNDIPTFISHSRPEIGQSHQKAHEMYSQLMDSIHHYSKHEDISTLPENENTNQFMNSNEFANLIDNDCTREDTLPNKEKANIPHVSILNQGYGCPPPSKREEIESQVTFRQPQKNEAFNEWLKSINCSCLEPIIYSAGITSKDMLAKVSGTSMSSITKYLKSIGVHKLGLRARIAIKLMEGNRVIRKWRAIEEPRKKIF